MAKKFGSKTISVRELITPAGQKPDEADVVKGIMDFSDTLTMDMAAFFVGNANKGKDMKTAQSNAKGNKNSLLGDKDSIYSCLQEIKMSLSSKDVKEQIPKSILLTAANSSLIKNALFNKEGQTVTQLLDEALIYHKETLENALNDFSQVISAFKDEWKRRDDLYETTFKNQKDTIDKITNLNDAYKNAAEAKLKLIIEGIDEFTIDSLIKFSQINLDNVNENTQILTTFFESLKVLENIDINDSLKNVSDLGPLLFSINASLEFLKVVNLDEDKVNKLNNILSSFEGTFEILKTLSDKKVNVKNVRDGIIGINEILGTLLISAPLFILVNKFFNHTKDKRKFGINLETTTIIFNKFSNLFRELDNIQTSNNVKQLVSSFGVFYDVLLSITKLIPLLGIINKSFNSTKSKQKFGINIEKTEHIITSFKTVFESINNLGDGIINGSKIIKSLFLFHFIAGGLKSSLLAISALKLGDLDNKKLFMTSVALKNISIVFDIINKMKTLDKDAKKKIVDVAQLFGDPEKTKKSQYNKFINTSLNHIFENISKTQIPEKTSLTGISNFITDIKTIIDNINSIQEISKNPAEIAANINEYLKILEDTYNKINERFDQIIGTGNKAEQIKAANEKIADAMESTNETIVKTSANDKEIKKSVIAMEGMTEFMISAAIVMSIGALIVMLGGGKFIKAALEFGIVLMIFEGLVLMPVLMFYNMQENALKGIGEFNKFIVTCTITMAIGALFMAIGGGKFVKRALEFGVLLFIFETLTVMPMLMFLGHKTDIFQSMADFSKFIITATIIMSIGSLFVSLGGGKFVRNALKFGIALAKFELYVIAPFLLFNLVKNDVMDNVKAFTNVLITTTIILFIGAAVMALSGGKLVKHAMKFARLLMKFEAMIIAPFLLFNFLRKSVFDGIRAFGTVVMVCTITLLVGAYFMKKPEWVEGAMEFAWTLMKFEALIIAPFLIFKLIGNQVMNGLKDFAVVVFVATTVLLVGSVFMTASGGKYADAALAFTGLLFTFEVAVLLPILAFGKLGGKPLENAREFGLFVALCSFSLIIGAFFIKQYGWEPAYSFGLLLGIFVTAMSGIVMWLEKRFKDRKPIEKAQEFGIFVLLCSTALIIGAVFVNKYGVSPVIGFGLVLVTFVGLMSAVVFGLNKMFESTGGVEKPIALMVAMGTFLILATGSLALGAWVVDTYGWKALAFVPLLMTFVVGIGAIFALIGLPPLFALIGLGAIAATAMGVALLALTTSLLIVNLLFELDPGGKKIKKNINTLNDDVLRGGVIFTFSILGALAVLIIPGGLAAVAMGVAMMALGSSLLIINLCVDRVKDTIMENIGILASAILGISGLGLELFAMIIPLTMGLPGLALLNIFSLGLTTSILMMYGSIKAMQSVGGDLTSQIDLIIKNLQAFINIPNKISLGGGEGFWGGVKNAAKLIGLNLMMTDIANIVKKAAYAIREIQSLKFNQDFEDIKQKVISILTTTPQAFLDAYDGNETKKTKGIKDINQYKINQIISFSKQIGEVIAGIAAGVGSMAKLQIPIGWDKNGNPISFRRLNDNDFTLASDNISKILTTMIGTFAHLWNDDITVQIDDLQFTLEGGLEPLLNNKDSSFNNIISFSKQIGEVISGIAEGVASMAKLKVATGWDPKTGKPTGYRTLSDKDFTDAANNTQIILSTLINAMAGLYESHRNDKGGNIFDMEDNWFTEDSPSPIMRVIETSFKISELLGNIGSGVKSIATLQIPTKWDQNGKPIFYETLKPTDFANAGQAVGQIVTCIIDALNKESYIDNSDDIKKVLDSVLPVSELISDMADGIIKLSSGLVADEWNDPKNPGKATHYKKLTKVDYVRSGQAIAQIVTCITNALINAYNGDGKNGGLKGILESDSFKEIVEAIGSTGDLISSIADSVIKIGSAQIPVYKNGKIDHYDKINIPEAQTNLSNVVKDIMMATVRSIIDVYNGRTGNDGLKVLLENENSPFLQATKGINEIMQSVSVITDSIIKLGSAQIPVYKNGQIDHYKPISVTDTISNIKKIFRGENGDGLLTILCKEIVNIATDYFNPNKQENNISGSVSAVHHGIQQISEIIKDTTEIVTNIGNLKFPTGFDKDGKPKGYDKIEKDTMKIAKKNIIDVMMSILSIFDLSNTDPQNENPLKKYLTEPIIQDANKKIIIDNLNNTKDIIGEVSQIVKQINEFSAGFNKLLKYRSSSKKSDKTFAISILNDVYYIIKGFAEFNEQFDVTFNTKTNLSKITSNITSIGSHIITIIQKVSEISKVIEQNDLNKISKHFNEESLKASLSTIINGFATIYQTISNPTKDPNDAKKYILIGALDQNKIQQISLNISTISSLTNTLIDEYVKNSQKITNVPILNKEDYNKKLESIKTFYVSIISVIKGINDELLQTVKIQTQEGDNTKQIFGTVSDYITSGINPFDNETFEKMDSLNTSMNDIYESIIKQEDHSKEFKSNTNALENYIKTINTVDIKKVSALSSLAQQLTNLANKLGNLDRLTDSIVNDLSEVLRDLVSSLSEAKSTINDAHQLQADRAKQIEQSISKVKSIMNMPLDINIQTMSNDPGQIPPGQEEKKDDKTTSKTPAGTPTGDGNKKQKKSNPSGNGSSRKPAGTGNQPK